MRYGIDIGEDSVLVIKFTPKGIIVRTGSADISSIKELLPESSEYIRSLATAIKKAARSARVPRGFGMPCTVVTGGAHVIIRKFTWPDLPVEALNENVLTELTPYLPGDPESFVIGHEILLREKIEDINAFNLQVLAAAMPKNLSTAIIKAVRKAGFKPSHLDVRENARGKIVSNLCKIADGEAPKSYALLDLSQAQANMALYLNGVFYSNRYFSATDNEDSKYDADALASEIVSIIDYIQYRERGANISYVLLMGENNLPGIEASLGDNLDIPIYAANSWLKRAIAYKYGKKGVRVPLVNCYDAFGSAMPSFNPKVRLDLMPTAKKSQARRLLLPFAATFIIIAALLTVGILFPIIERNNLRSEIDRLDAELAQFIVTPARVAALNLDIAQMSGHINDLEAFFAYAPQAITVLPILFDSGLTVTSIHAAGTTITLVGSEVDFNRLADAAVILRENEFVESVVIHSARDESTIISGFNTAEFNIIIELRGMK